MLTQEALEEWDQRFAGLRQDKVASGFGPVELVAGGLGGDPDLADWSVGRDDELAGAILEDDVHNAVIVFEFEVAGVVFGGNEGLLERFECGVGFASEAGFVEHRSSVTGGNGTR